MTEAVHTFLEDYREANRFLYLEHYPIQNDLQLVFLKLPPVQARYPNPKRVVFCKQSKAVRQARPKDVTFELKLPGPEKPEIDVYGYSEYYRNLFSVPVVEESVEDGIEWSMYVQHTPEVLQKKEEKAAAEAAKRGGAKKRRVFTKLDKARTEKMIRRTPDVERASKIMQKYTRIWLARSKLRKLDKKAFTRMNVCRELSKTEDQYVAHLNTLKRVYLDPFKQLSLGKGARVISPQDFAQVFGGLEAIIKLNEGLAESLRQCIFNAETGEYRYFAPISKELLAIAPFIRMYKTYCSKYERTLDRLEKLRSGGRFRQVLERMDKDAATTRLGLPSYLIMPIQRVPRYKLLLRDVLKATHDEHPDKVGLTKAIGEIEETASYLNNAMKEIEESEKVIAIQKKFADTKRFVIHQPHRRFIREGLMYQGRIKGKSPIYVHLFNDVLVFSARNPKGIYEFKSKMELRFLKLYRSDDLLCQRSLKINDQIYTAKTVQDRDDWLEKLLDAALEVVPAEQTHGGSSSARGGAVGVGAGIVGKKEEFTMSILECIEYCKNMERPTILLKYVSTRSLIRRRPHDRKFVISQDESKVMWGSPRKSLTDSSIELSEVKELVEGQTTLAFRREKKPSAVGLSFSILYGKGEIDKDGFWTGSTLDLICHNKKDYLVWTQALKYLIQNRPRGRKKGGIQRADPTASALLRMDKKKMRETRDARFQALGDAYTWGHGTLGALGHGHEQDQPIPKVVLLLLSLDVADQICGRNCAAAVMRDGSVLTWGHGEFGKLGHGNGHNVLQPRTVTALQEVKIMLVRMGDHFTLFLDDAGKVWVSGSNKEGCLTDHITAAKINTPKMILPDREIKTMEAGNNHCGVVLKDGSVLTWGTGDLGQLGHGRKEESPIPIPTVVEGLRGNDVAQLAFGNWHSLALTSDGNVFSWGDGNFGQLGIPKGDQRKMESLSPILISSLKNVTCIASGQSHCGAITADGKCYMWGAGNYGQAGNGKKRSNFEPVTITRYMTVAYSSRPKRMFLSDSDKFKSIVCGANHCLALVECPSETKSGEPANKILAWGAGTYGRLGIKTEMDAAIPQEVVFLAKKKVRSLHAYGQMSCACCAHQWIPDEEVKECMKCNRSFTTFRRRHHCRHCGGIFCNKCSSQKITIMEFGYDEKTRVCDVCFSLLSRQHV